jgi:hypothetical protein
MDLSNINANINHDVIQFNELKELIKTQKRLDIANQWIDFYYRILGVFVRTIILGCFLYAIYNYQTIIQLLSK